MNNNVPRNKYKLDPAEYRVVLTNLCATLRNPRSKNGRSENERNTNKSDKGNIIEKIKESENNDGGESESRKDIEETNIEEKKRS